MKGRETKTTTKGPPSADLLVCFPSRPRLNIMPKPVCSPARSLEPSKSHRRWHRKHHVLKSRTRGGQASPLLWTKTKQMASEIAEPSSPKVTCAGQIKIKPKVASSKSWQSVMEEIERIHNSRKLKKRPSWLEGLGFKKEVTQLLTCLRSIRFRVRCFGSLPQPEVTTDDEDEEDNEYEIRYQNNHVGIMDDTSRTVFSKWFMVLQENQNTDLYSENRKRRDGHSFNLPMDDAPSAPPPNALLLMRCRSAPTESWSKKDEHERKEEKMKKLRYLIDDEKKEEEEKKEKIFMAMKYDDTVSCRNSFENDKQKWMFGGIRDPFSRSKSWKR